jgi:hypothetical protein
MSWLNPDAQSPKLAQFSLSLSLFSLPFLQQIRPRPREVDPLVPCQIHGETGRALHPGAMDQHVAMFLVLSHR